MGRMILVDRDSGGAFTAPFAGTASGYPGVPVVAGRRWLPGAARIHPYTPPRLASFMAL